MAQPTPYVPSVDFSDFSTLNPDTPQSGVGLDAQFNALKLTTDETLTNLAMIQRDDGLLANGIVTPDSLSDEIYAGISRAVPWITATNYVAGDLVWYLSILYSANGDHTSTTDPTVDTGNWTVILDMTSGVPDIITQDAQDAADAAAASEAVATAAAAATTSVVSSVSYLWAGTATGAANTLVLTPVPTMTSYTEGHKLRFVVGTTNTGAVVMNTANALGSVTIKKSIGDALVELVAGDMVAGTIAEIEYISVAAGYQLLNPATYSQGTDVASATTVNLNTTTGDYVSITGTTTITGITLAQGRQRTVTFAAALTLTHSASLILKNGGSDITTAAGDSAVFRGEASGVVRMVGYNRAASVDYATPAQGALADAALQPTEATKLTQSATVTSTSGVTVAFTGIPSGVKKIDLSVHTLSTSGTSKIELAIGGEVTGYIGTITQLAAGSVATDQHPTDAFTVVRSPSASASLSGTVTLTLVDADTFTWSVSGGFGHNDATSNYIVRGSKALSAELTQIQLQTANGTDTFDAGLVSIQYYKDA